MEHMNEAPRRVVVTGLGVVTPLGTDLGLFWRALTNGASAVRPISRFDASSYPTRIAAEISEHDPVWTEDVSPLLRGAGRIGIMAGVAARHALADSGLLAGGPAKPPVAVVIAVGAARYQHLEIVGPCAAVSSADHAALHADVLRRELRRSLLPSAALRLSSGALATELLRWLGLEGPVMAIMTACSAGAQVIIDATRWIRNGMVDVAICGASDSELHPLGLASLCLLGAPSTRNDDPRGASRPFDAERDGFVLGEGAGFLVLEELERAKERHARIHAELVGCGSACDAYRLTDLHPLGKGAVRAIGQALREARIEPADVDYINAHGTSTIQNDRVETQAIKQVFGPSARSVPISSIKSMIGHLIVAAGAVEAVATIMSLTTGTIPPTINYRTADPECDLDYVPNRSREFRGQYALSNSFAFGGHCASLLFQKYQEEGTGLEPRP